MGWLPKPSAFQHAQQQAAKRRAHAQDYLNQQTSLSTAIFAAKDNAATKFTELVMQSTIERVTREGEARLEKARSEMLSALDVEA